jgi:SOS-response transcriptional repressor LexA
MTHRQKQTYDFIRGFWQEHGFGPTYREIATAIGASGPGRAFTLVAALEERNWVRIGYRDSATASNRGMRTEISAAARAP